MAELFPVLLWSVCPCRHACSRFPTSICQENVMSGCKVTKHLRNNNGMEERETEGVPNGDLVGSASVNCENYISVSS